MRIVSGLPRPVKVCHAKPGDVVQFEKGRALYLVCARQDGTPARCNMPHGLYDDKRTIFLVGLENGLEYPIPHLSSKLIVREDVAVVALNGVAVAKP